MAVSTSKRASVLAAALLCGIGLMLPGTPASAQPFPDPTQATLLVGGDPLIEVNCPTPIPAQQEAGTSSNLVATASGAASCGNAPAANTQGTYTLAGEGFSPLPFSSGCQSSTGDSGGSVVVPAGTRINGGAPVAGPTIVDTPNTPVVYPNGTTAVLNQVTTTPTSVTRSAIVLANGTIIGRVICGQSGVYPLRVDVGGTAGAPAALPTPVSADGGGISTSVLVLGGAFALAVLAQLTIGRTMRRRKAGATG